MNHRQFTYAKVAKYFEYDPEEGKLYRRQLKGRREITLTRYNRSSSSWEANHVNLLMHGIIVTHVIFMLQAERWPAEGMFIDHINGDVFDNRWLNLREVTPKESAWNRLPGQRAVGTEDGMERGVKRCGNHYRIELWANGQQTDFGRYDTKAEANAFALAKRLELHGEYAFEVSRGLLIEAPKLPWRRPVIRDITHEYYAPAFNRRGL